MFIASFRSLPTAQKLNTASHVLLQNDQGIFSFVFKLYSFIKLSENIIITIIIIVIIISSNSQENRMYERRVLELEQASFTPLLWSFTPLCAAFVIIYG